MARTLFHRFHCRLARTDPRQAAPWDPRRTAQGGRLTWWDAFTRFGGYAASTFTGLLGFLEILWDANRQGLHDRIAGTVVVREGHEASPERADEWRAVDPFGG